MSQLPYDVGLVNIDKAFFDNSFKGLYSNRIFSRYLLHRAFLLDSVANLLNYFVIRNFRQRILCPHLDRSLCLLWLCVRMLRVGEVQSRRHRKLRGSERVFFHALLTHTRFTEHLRHLKYKVARASLRTARKPAGGRSSPLR